MTATRQRDKQNACKVCDTLSDLREHPKLIVIETILNVSCRE
jgi:hypothetical protein